MTLRINAGGLFSIADDVLHDSADALTIGVLIKTTYTHANLTYPTIFQHDASDMKYGLRAVRNDAAGGYGFAFYGKTVGGTRSASDYGSVINDGDLHLLVGVYDKTKDVAEEFAIYLDGAFVSYGTGTSFSLLAGDEGITFGGSVVPIDLGELALWPVAITPAQVATWWNGGAPESNVPLTLNATQPVVYCPLIEDGTNLGQDTTALVPAGDTEWVTPHLAELQPTFSDDFDRANGAYWLPIDDPAGPWTTHAQTGGAQLGISSNKMQYATENGDAASLTYIFLDNLTEAWCRVKVNPTTMGWAAGGNNYVIPLRLADGTGGTTTLAYLYLSNTTGTPVWCVGYEDGGMQIVSDIATYTAGVETTIELHLKIGNGDGEIQVWFDGVLCSTVNFTNLTNNAYTLDQLWMLAEASAGASNTVIGTLDDLAVAAARIYPPDYGVTVVGGGVSSEQSMVVSGGYATLSNLDLQHPRLALHQLVSTGDDVTFALRSATTLAGLPAASWITQPATSAGIAQTAEALRGRYAELRFAVSPTLSLGTSGALKAVFRPRPVSVPVLMNLRG